MKIMIVSGDKAIRESIARAIYFLSKGGEEFEFIKVDHQEALERFLTEEPMRVIISEYEEDESIGQEEHNRGHITFKDIKGSASEDVIIIRMGFSSYDYKDYVKAHSVSDFMKMLKLWQRKRID